MTDFDKDIHQVNDGFFHKIFDNPINARDFLEKVLPPALKMRIDFSTITVENTRYVSNEFGKGFSDIVVKALFNTAENTKKTLVMYFIIEHKTEGRVEIFLQILKYMVFEWEKDYNSNKPPRLIIPVVFYNGSDRWKVPLCFSDQFDIDTDLKQFILDFRYVLFDTNHWNYKEESNRDLRENVHLFSTMVLMKLAYKNDLESIREIFQFWDERGFPNNNDLLHLFMRYICSTQDVMPDKLEKILEESKINGGEIMPTLAQRWKNEGKEEFMQTEAPKMIKLGEKRGEKRGEKKGKMKVAYELYKRGVDLELIIETTGLSGKEISIIASNRVEYNAGYKRKEK